MANFVKTFLWKVINDILSTKANLFKRMIVPNSNCLICENEEEIVSHALWSCQLLLMYGQKLPAPYTSGGVWKFFFSCLWNELLNRLLFKELEGVVVISQRIWYRRNNFVFNCDLKVQIELLRKQKLQGKSTNKRKLLSQTVRMLSAEFQEKLKEETERKIN